ncbi:MAG: chemotaxis protein [Clostridia bacterium]|jgi:two-component system chemotaxis response regulator CheV|nr:chemotaxis protein [Clostridia bacterium]
MAESKILLESGTNELEIVTFDVAGNTYGINVAKVNKILPVQELSMVPKASPCIKGIFQYMERVVPLVSLEKYLNLGASETPEKNKIIVTQFNGVFSAFDVHDVSRIHRISWESVETPDADSVTYNEAVTGVIRMGEKIILLLDFEKIIYEISPHHEMLSDNDSNDARFNSNVRSSKAVLIAEDSEMLRQVLENTLKKAGYTNLIKFTNGSDAWDYMDAIANGNPDGLVVPELVITDIEMPKMDGHRLTKLIRETKMFLELPIIIFSSLINEQMYDKGVSIGASEQISKPQLLKLIHVLDEYLM